MSLYLEINYAKIIGQSIERWKIKKESPFHGQGRCNCCGDSATNKSKSRFHIIQKDDKLIVHCFNCGYSARFTTYLKSYFNSLYNEFFFEKYRKDVSSPIIKKVEVKDEVFKVIPVKRTSLGLKLIRDLPENHPARLYVTSRNLPDYPFMYTDEFYKFSSEFNSELSNNTRDEPRLIIPFFDRDGSIFAYQGRDLSGKSNQKYITITINDKIPKIFGIDRVNLSKQVILVEGPIDSLFMSNCLASVNASLVATAKKLTSILNKNLLTLCFDNEPRNKTIVDMYEQAIKSGYNVVIWPKAVDGIKDINDMVLNNKNPSKIIQNNTFSGLSAQLEFQNWKKV